MQVMDQNTLELQLALEELEACIGQKSFHKRLFEIEALIKQIKLPNEEEARFKERFQQIGQEHQSQMGEESEKLRSEIEAKLAEVQLKDSEVNHWPSFQAAFEKARAQYEDIQEELKRLHYQFQRKDRDFCWQALKSQRQEWYDMRDKARDSIQEQAESYFLTAQKSVKTQPTLNIARQEFIAVQKELNALPLRRKERQQYQVRFDELWQELQGRYKEHRSNKKEKQKQWRDRQEDGLKRLGEALERVNTFITKKTAELKEEQDKLENTPWHEHDSLESQVSRIQAALTDAQRRQNELQQKIADAQSRLAAESHLSVEGHSSSEGHSSAD